MRSRTAIWFISKIRYEKAHFVAHSFEDFTPRKGFRCAEYLQKF